MFVYQESLFLCERMAGWMVGWYHFFLFLVRFLNDVGNNVYLSNYFEVFRQSCNFDYIFLLLLFFKYDILAALQSF